MSEQPFSLTILPDALKQIRDLPKNVRNNMDAKITLLTHTPQPQMAKPLRGMKGVWRLRVGDYRVLYALNHDARLITVLQVGHRKDVYRGS